MHHPGKEVDIFCCMVRFYLEQGWILCIGTGSRALREYICQLVRLERGYDGQQGLSCFGLARRWPGRKNI